MTAQVMIKVLWGVSFFLIAHGFIGLTLLYSSSYFHLFLNLFTLGSGCAILLILTLTTNER